MFIKMSKSGYNRNGEQFAHGLFLVLCQPENGCVWNDTRAFVRFCKMSQFGAWMMGRIKVGSYKLTISGSYGSDGLPDTVPNDIWENAMPIPVELMEKYKNGGGWNSAGSEAPLFKKWALENLAALRKAGKLES